MVQPISNRQIADVLYEMAALYEMQAVQFKPRAYEKAAQAVEGLAQPVAEIYEQAGLAGLQKISGVGAAIAEHIEAIIHGREFAEHTKLKRQVPVRVNELIAVEGVGPKTVKTLYEELGVKDLKGLEQAVRNQRVRKLAGFGARSEAKIKKGIEFLKAAGSRRVLGFMYGDIERLRAEVAKLPGVKKAAIAGSIRRMKPTIGDIDILAISDKPEAALRQFTQLPQVDYIYGQGETKANVRLAAGLDADLRIVPPKSWGAALNYLTGSREHNVALRERAQARGWKLSEYGLYKGTRQISGQTERGLYQKLGLRYIEPELREMTGELEAAEQGDLPKLIGYNDLRGDLQIQTDWTDGRHSIEEMAKAAMARGLDYIAITDHTRSLAMTGGADEQQLLRQIKAIDQLNRRFERHNFRILTGAEVNIGKDGTLDIEDDVLAQLEVVGAAIHSHFGLTKQQQTRRILRAMENPHVDIIFHLTTRRIGRRDMIAHDIDTIIQAAADTGTVLEIDAYPDRLDINEQYVRKCVEAGVKMSIDSDAHATGHFDYLRFGIATARRGWATADDIINAHPVKTMLDLLK